LDGRGVHQVSGPVKEYLKKVEKELQSGNTTEHSHRPHLKSLIESFDKTILAINEPKRVKCGAPDYIVVRKQTPLGYIEAKDVGIPLGNEEKSEQMTRYRSSLSNLILTDYLEFRWYVRGAHRLTARIGETSLNQVKADGDGIKKFLEMVNAFLNVQVSTVGSPKELAQRMAALARLIRETIQQALSDEDKGGTLRDQMEGFREVLLHDLTEDQFADMYAQSICYGLFAARCNSDAAVRFTREHAAYDLPKTNPFLRKMFSYIAGPELDDRVAWVLDDLAELLHHCDMSSILQDFGKRTRREDPVVHFYETFLSAYDPKMREMRGVYYTPEPVVSYIVRSVDQILKRDFGLKKGIADASKITVETSSDKKKRRFHKVQILDPACGTGTFLHGVVDEIQESFGGNEGMWSGYVSEHLLPRLWGFELLMAPYAVAHMKLGLQFRESGYDFRADERLRIFLTNTLEEAKDTSSKLPFAQWIADEANAAGKVKAEVPVMVVLGNPPYSGHSANKGEWIKGLLKGQDKESAANYFMLDGAKLKEDQYQKSG
jgi:predicted helicase